MKLFVSIISAIVLLGSVNSVSSQTSQDLTEQAYGINTITTAVPFLLIAPDARGGAMGDAGAGTSPDCNALNKHPEKYRHRRHP